MTRTETFGKAAWAAPELVRLDIFGMLNKRKAHEWNERGNGYGHCNSKGVGHGRDDCTS